jgi:carbamoyl-phosphate synthase large subunit
MSTIHVDKVGEGSYDPVKLIEDGRIDLVINTPAGGKARGDGRLIRRTATRYGIPTVTTAAGGMALVLSIESARTTDEQVVSLQDHHRSVAM